MFWQSRLSIMYQTLAIGGTCQEVFLASSHTTSTAQSVEEPSRHKKSLMVPAVFTHKRTITVMGIETVDVGVSVRNYCMALYGYHGSKCTIVKDAMQKYLSTDRKWEINLQGQSHFYYHKKKGGGNFGPMLSEKV